MSCIKKKTLWSSRRHTQILIKICREINFCIINNKNIFQFIPPFSALFQIALDGSESQKVEDILPAVASDKARGKSLHKHTGQ